MLNSLAAYSANFLAAFAGGGGSGGPSSLVGGGSSGCSEGCLETVPFQTPGGDPSPSSPSAMRLRGRSADGGVKDQRYLGGRYVAAGLLALGSSALLSLARAKRRATGIAVRRRLSGGRQRRLILEAIGQATVEAPEKKLSPFKDSNASADHDGDGKLALTWENVDTVLDELRPFLRNDGGDCRIVQIDGPIVRLELQGSCSDCSASSVTLKMGIEKTLVERIPEIVEVVAVTPDQEPMTREAVEKILDVIRPLVKSSGSTIRLKELVDSPSQHKIVLEMTGPLLKSMAVKAEVQNRIRKKFPLLQEVKVVSPGEEQNEEEEEVVN